MEIIGMSLGERRRVARETGVIQIGHKNWCERPSDHDLRYHYEILGRIVEFRFPYCCYLHEVMTWQGSDHMRFLEKFFGVWCTDSERHAQFLLMMHTSRQQCFVAHPHMMQRGPHRYYCLRDLARASYKTYCIECGCRTRQQRIAEKYPNDFRRLQRLVGEDKGWNSEYIYFCSPECLRRRENRERRQKLKQEKRREMENVWLKKARTKLKECRRLIRKKLPRA